MRPLEHRLMRKSTAQRLTSWAAKHARRYGPPELLCKAVAIPLAYVVQYHTYKETGSNEAAAAIGGAAGSLVETITFYGYLVPRDIRKDAQEAKAQGKPYGREGAYATICDLVREFGPAELLDTFITRPLLIGLGQGTAGTPESLEGSLLDKGATVGRNLLVNGASMLAADLIFYSWPILYQDRIKPWYHNVARPWLQRSRSKTVSK